MKPMIIKGAGELFTYATINGVQVPQFLGNKFNSLKVDFKVDIEKVYGGDGLFQIDSFLKNKEIDITVENAEFDLAQLATLLGRDVSIAQAGTEVWKMGEVHKPVAATSPATTTTIDLDFKSTYVPGSLMAKYRDGSGTLEVVATSGEVTGAGKIYVNNGTVTYHTNDAGKEILLYYKRTVTADTVPIMIDDEPMILGIVHQGRYRQKDNTIQAFEIEIYAAQPYGNFSLEGKRRAASTHGISLSVQDAGRADGKLGEIKRFTV